MAMVGKALNTVIKGDKILAIASKYPPIVPRRTPKNPAMKREIKSLNREYPKEAMAI